MQAGGRSLRLLSGVLGVGFCKLSKSRIVGGQHGTQGRRKKDAGGGAGCRRRACPSGCSGAGFVLYMDGRKNSLYVGAAPHLLPFSPSFPFFLFLFGRVVRIGCRGGFQAGRDAGGRLLSAGSRRAAGRRAGRQAGRAVAGRLSVCLCPRSLSFGVLGVVLALACWALGVLCWAGLAWAAVGAGACRCWAGCPGHQAGCYPSYCTKFCLKIQHDAENDASCFGIFTA